MDKEAFHSAVSLEIRVAMARRRVCQKALAADMGVSQATISKKLNGLSPFRATELAHIAIILDVPLSALITPAAEVA